jgi:hypothetical protein
VAAATIATASAALAQAVGDLKVFNGTIVSTATESVVIKDKDGQVLMVAVVRNWDLIEQRPITADQLKTGDFVGSQNKPIDANSGEATELRVYEPGNTPEWGTHGLGPNTPNRMTHGTISNIASTATGRVLEIAYPTGGYKLILADAIKPQGSFSLGAAKATPGVSVSAVSRMAPDGVYRASRLLLRPQ